MPVKLAAALPPDMDLDFTYTLRWAALDPTTGNPVSGVVVHDASMLVTQLTPGSAGDLEAGPFMLVPGPGS